MNPTFLAACAAACTLAIAPSLPAHGGVYRGPGDIVPDRPAGGGGRTPGPGGPTTGGPSGPTVPGRPGPTTGGPGGPTSGGPPTGGPGGGAGPRTGGGGLVLGANLESWQHWWEFNKDRFLRLKQALHSEAPVTGSDDFFVGRARRDIFRNTLRPSQKEIETTVVPALLRAVEEETDRDIVSSSLVALARTGMEAGKVLPLLRSFLPSRDQEIAETAALAMGILGSPAAVDDLAALALETPQGHRLVGRSGGTHYRTRSFAVYALGLIAHENNDVDTKEKVFQTLRRLVEDDQVAERNVKVAAINAIRLLRVHPRDGGKAEALFHEALGVLMAYYQARRSGQHLVQAHVPTAVATLVGRGTESGETFRRQFLRDLEDEGTSNWIRQSCAVALGFLASPGDVEVSRALQRIYQSRGDLQMRYFALMALGEIGGPQNRLFLLDTLSRARNIDKAWAGLALGVLAWNVRESDPSLEWDAAVGEALLGQLTGMSNRDIQAGLCVALGLARHPPAADTILGLIRRYAHDDELTGYASLAVGMMGWSAARDEIRTLVAQSVRRPERLQQAAIALGLLGDKTAAEMLVQMLAEQTSLAAQNAVASALGSIGDSRTIGPLVDMLFQRQGATSKARAYAAVALGIVADREDQPWNAKVAAGLNYRANTETLTRGGAGGIAGVLDIR